MKAAVALALVMAINQSSPVGRIVGVVADPTGGTMPGVTITVSDAGGQSRTAVTDVRGRYEITGLTPGIYGARAQLAGFLTRRADALRVIDQRSTEWNVSLTTLSAVIVSPRSATVRDPTPIEVSRSVYAAALSAIRDLSMPVTIRSVSLVVPQEFHEDLWEGPLQSVPKELRETIAAKGAAEAVLLNPDSLPSFARLADPDAPAETRSRMSLSRAFVTPSGLDALVVYTHWCGNLCGTADAIWTLHRSTITRACIMAGWRVFWES